jgi:hypothetical protein
MKKLILPLFFIISASATAGDVFTCSVNGKTVYQGKPCAGSKELADRIKQSQANIVDQKIAAEKERAEWNAKKEPRVGMTKAEAEKTTWGYPDKTSTTTTASNVFEQWVYRTSYSGSKYLHFTNGRITSISE